MTDAASITAGFADVSDRWGQLNSLVHTIGPGDGYFEQMDDAAMGCRVHAWHHVGRAVDSRRVAHAARARTGPAS